MQMFCKLSINNRANLRHNGAQQLRDMRLPSIPFEVVLVPALGAFSVDLELPETIPFFVYPVAE